MTTEQPKTRRRRGPNKKKAATSSTLAAPTGPEAEPTPEVKPDPAQESGTSPTPSDDLSAQLPSESENSESDMEKTTPSDVSTPAMNELRARQEAQAQAEPASVPHKFVYEVTDAKLIPVGFLHLMTGDIDDDAIDAMLQRCADIGTTPQIPGVMISHKVR